ncbi:MAG: hypothetical protein QOJ65_1230 [Fimbriimonadaceae bacterium]|jgi:cell division protein FtsI/penicillin-binding protein 2|nr:hypothetical protein [Fimbriimonadaceae bacterium]
MPGSIFEDRMKLATYSFMGLIGLAAYSQASVQVFRRGDVLARARDSKKFELSVPSYANRGRILASDGRPLAQDEDSYVLQVNFERVPHSEGFFADLAEATGIPATEFRELALAGKGSREWRLPLSAAQSAKVKKVKSDWRANGLAIPRSGLRAYALAESAAGIVGQIRDKDPIAGMEASQNTALAGKDGVTVGFVDRTGAFLPMLIDKKSSIPKTDGVDIQTTIDYDLQQAASRAIRKAVETNKADQGVAIIMDPTTGDILAMANWPTFDPSVEGGKGLGMSVARDLNPAVQAVLEPGSMFKVLTLAKALDSGAIQPDEHFKCVGQETVGRKTFTCDRHEVHGNINITDAIAESCNVTASRWSRRVGYDDFVGYFEDLGLMEKPGIGLPGEVTGQFNYKETAKKLQLALVGFGQSINVTPAALAGAFSMIANDGKLMFPRLISRIGTQVIPPEQAAQVVSPESANTVLQCMEAVVESDEGTGKGLRIPGYRLAGKTGTAQRRDPITGRVGGGAGHVANFIGFVPAQHPKVSILVMVDHPTAGSFYGASVAGPVFKELAQASIRRFAIPPTEGNGHSAADGQPRLAPPPSHAHAAKPQAKGPG